MENSQLKQKIEPRVIAVNQLERYIVEVVIDHGDCLVMNRVHLIPEELRGLQPSFETDHKKSNLRILYDRIINYFSR